MIRDDTVYLAHMVDAAEQILLYTAELDYTTFAATRIVQDAVIRQFEIIGEAAKNLTQQFRSQNENIPWKDLAGFRDKLIHQYFGVDLATVWTSVEVDVPVLLSELQRLQLSSPAQ